MTIARQALDEVLAHARESQPQECCGMLIGADSRILTAVRARNLAASPTRYLIDPKDHLDALRTARQRNLDVLGFYHSHPRSTAFPSETDLSEAAYPDCVYLIVGLQGDQVDARLFRFGNGTAEETEMIVESNRGI